MWHISPQSLRNIAHGVSRAKTEVQQSEKLSYCSQEINSLLHQNFNQHVIRKNTGDCVTGYDASLAFATRLLNHPTPQINAAVASDYFTAVDAEAEFHCYPNAVASMTKS